MIDFYDDLYTSIVNKNKFLQRARFYSLLRFLIRVSVNAIAPVYFTLTQHRKQYALEKSNKEYDRIIVTLTSFPARINRIWLTIETILRQTQKPDKIILWLSIEQFPTLQSLPKKLLDQMARGLEIVLKENDIRSHKKYYYTLREFPNDYMLTIDDDIFYRSTMIQDLKRYAYQYPNAIISQYVKEIIWENGVLSPYIKWPAIKEERLPNLHAFFGTGGGTLFPPKALNQDVTNATLFMNLAPNADDVWLNAMCRLNKIKTLQTRYYATNLPVINFRDVTLQTVNVNEGLNDKQIKNIIEYYQTNYQLDPFEKLD